MLPRHFPARALYVRGCAGACLRAGGRRRLPCSWDSSRAARRFRERGQVAASFRKTQHTAHSTQHESGACGSQTARAASGGAGATQAKPGAGERRGETGPGMGEKGKRGHEEGVPLNSEKICMCIYIYIVTLIYARYSLSVHK